MKSHLHEIFAVIVVSACMIWMFQYTVHRNTVSNELNKVEKEMQFPENCFDWAFGSDWRTYQSVEIPDLWNKRHIHIFKMNVGDRIKESIVKIKSACKAEGIKE